MATDYFSELTEAEVKTLLKQLQKALLQGTRQIMFKDQQISWSSNAELKERISLAQESLEVKNPSGAASRKKMVRFKTINKGY